MKNIDIDRQNNNISNSVEYCAENYPELHYMIFEGLEQRYAELEGALKHTFTNPNDRNSLDIQIEWVKDVNVHLSQMDVLFRSVEKLHKESALLHIPTTTFDTLRIICRLDVSEHRDPDFFDQFIGKALEQDRNDFVTEISLLQEICEQGKDRINGLIERVQAFRQAYMIEDSERKIGRGTDIDFEIPSRLESGSYSPKSHVDFLSELDIIARELLQTKQEIDFIKPHIADPKAFIPELSSPLDEYYNTLIKNHELNTEELFRVLDRQRNKIDSEEIKMKYQQILENKQLVIGIEAHTKWLENYIEHTHNILTEQEYFDLINKLSELGEGRVMAQKGYEQILTLAAYVSENITPTNKPIQTNVDRTITVDDLVELIATYSEQPGDTNAQLMEYLESMNEVFSGELLHLADLEYLILGIVDQETPDQLRERGEKIILRKENFRAITEVIDSLLDSRYNDPDHIPFALRSIKFDILLDMHFQDHPNLNDILPHIIETVEGISDEELFRLDKLKGDDPREFYSEISSIVNSIKNQENKDSAQNNPELSQLVSKDTRLWFTQQGMSMINNEQDDGLKLTAISTVMELLFKTKGVPLEDIPSPENLKKVIGYIQDYIGRYDRLSEEELKALEVHVNTLAFVSVIFE